MLRDLNDPSAIDLHHLRTAVTAADNRSCFFKNVVPEVKALLNINGLMVVLTQSPECLAEPFLLHLDVKGMEPEQNEPWRKASDGGLIEKILLNGQPIAWPMAELMKLEQRPDFVTRYRVNEVKNVAAVPLVDRAVQKGILFFFSGDKDGLTAREFPLLAQIAIQLSNAVFNIQANANIAELLKEREMLMSLNKTVALNGDRNQFQKFLKSEFLRLHIPGDICLFLTNNQNGNLSPMIIRQLKDGIFGKEWLNPQNFEIGNESSFLQSLRQLYESIEFDIGELTKFKEVPSPISEWSKNGAKKLAVIHLINNDKCLGVLFFIAKSEEGYQPFSHFLGDIGVQVTVLAANLLAREKIEIQLGEIAQYKRRLEDEDAAVRNINQGIPINHGLVGNSPRIKEVFQMIAQVAETTSSVLILGETGTGKELLAHAIHNSSARKERMMIKVNCATLPANLIESELFGHERGSFTGAVDRRIGKFELANNSTIFLDEIGELPLPLQAKLLRTLQEKEIERIGGKVTIKTDIRIVAATNRDLFKAVQQGTFRADLYFRLNVFPVTLPALRERKDDIPLLANYFATKFSKRSTGNHFSSKAMKQLVAYNWPGNVRELEHLVQRSVLLAKGKVVSQVYFHGANGTDPDQPLINTDVKTIEEVERDHILSVLKMVNGKVSGVGGAAEILKMPPTSLNSKMIKLKIKKGLS